jgi:hypothetical protein
MDNQLALISTAKTFAVYAEIRNTGIIQHSSCGIKSKILMQNASFHGVNGTTLRGSAATTTYPVKCEADFTGAAPRLLEGKPFKIRLCEEFTTKQ